MGETASHCEHRISSVVAAGVWKACGERHGEDVYCVGFNASSTCKGKFPGQSGRSMLSILSWGVGRTAVTFPSLSDADSIQPERGYCMVGVGIQTFFCMRYEQKYWYLRSFKHINFYSLSNQHKMKRWKIHNTSWHIFPFACF